ncbi:MAG: YihY/virulence factor BrkB family protein [Tatlockia sp.]|nr:YihY/virulence factor BrkB family protein [Tatlockia sp.]
MNIQTFWTLCKETVAGWSKDKISALSAGLAYYTIFSLGPLLIISIVIAGFVFGREAVQGQLLEQVSRTFGEGSAFQIKEILLHSFNPTKNFILQAIAVVVMLFGASGVFGALQAGLNTIWGVEQKSGKGFWRLIKDRFLSISMVLGVGFLLLVSLLFTVLLSSASSYINSFLPGGSYLGLALNFIFSLVGVTILFAMIFKFLPDVQIKWSEVWLGAFITTLLFTLGKFLLGLYLGYSNVGKNFGPSASLILILIWVYYSAQILFLGAEFTKAYANLGRKHGR